MGHFGVLALERQEYAVQIIIFNYLDHYDNWNTEGFSLNINYNFSSEKHPVTSLNQFRWISGCHSCIHFPSLPTLFLFSSYIHPKLILFCLLMHILKTNTRRHNRGFSGLFLSSQTTYLFQSLARLQNEDTGILVKACSAYRTRNSCLVILTLFFIFVSHLHLIVLSDDFALRMRRETWRNMEELYRIGLCKHIGVSNYEATKKNFPIFLCNIKSCFTVASDLYSLH